MIFSRKINYGSKPKVSLKDRIKGAYHSRMKAQSDYERDMGTGEAEKYESVGQTMKRNKAKYGADYYSRMSPGRSKL